MTRDEQLEIDTAGSPTSPQRQTLSTDASTRADDRLYGSILGMVMVGAEIVWLCALAYLAYLAYRLLA